MFVTCVRYVQVEAEAISSQEPLVGVYQHAYREPCVRLTDQGVYTYVYTYICVHALSL